MKKYKIFWTKEATADLEEIFDYIAEERPSAAKSVFKKIKSKFVIALYYFDNILLLSLSIPSNFRK